jgi:hypothetical protein
MPQKLLPWLLAITLLAGCKTTSPKAKSTASAHQEVTAVVGNLGGATTTNPINTQSINEKVSVKPEQTDTVPTSKLGVTSVEIKNDWNGYSDITPIVRHYKFLPQDEGLEGNGNFAVGGYGGYGIQQQYTKKIAIDPTLTQQFLQTLAATKITKSDRYNPRRDHNDDYPDITIRIKTPSREVTFASRSQGEQNIPWQVQIKTKGKVESFISNSPNPAEALDLLKEQIDHPGLEQAIRRANAVPSGMLRKQANAKHQKTKPTNSAAPTEITESDEVAVSPRKSRRAKRHMRSRRRFHQQEEEEP